MTWTTPRTWVTSELVTAAMLNEQVRDNANYLAATLENVTTGHDHDGADSKQIAWANMPAATQVTWISGMDVVGYTAEGQAARPHQNGYTEGPYSDNYEMLFPFPIPTQLMGRAVQITEIKFYYYTDTNTEYFDAIYLRRSDLDGTYTDDLSYTTDLGNGSSGNANATLLSTGDTPITLADFPYHLVVKCGGGASFEEWRVYGFRVTWRTV